MTRGGIQFDVSGGVGHITLNRPNSSNSFDLENAALFAEIIDAAEHDDDVRALVISGNGRHFCAGGDVASMKAAPDRSTYIADLATTLDGALQQLASMSKPVVAGVHGAVAGAGLGVMLSCDLIVAAGATKFLAAYAGIGLTPDCGVSWLLPRAVGQPRAMDIILNGRVLTAEEALGWGLVTEVVVDNPRARTETLALRLAGGPGFAHGQARRLARSAWQVDRRASGRDESATIARAVVTARASALLDGFE